MEFVKGFLQVIIDFVFYLIPREKPTQAQLKELKIVCHRGLHNKDGIQENTIESFDYALKNGLWGIEFDIRWTKDLVPIVHHDANCMRVWEKDVAICDLTFRELRSSIPEIPSLSEVIDRFGKKIHFFIELKKENFPDKLKQKEILREQLASLVPIEDFHFLCLETQTLQVFDLYGPKVNVLVANFNLIEMSRLAMENHYGGVSGHYLLAKSDL